VQRGLAFEFPREKQYLMGLVSFPSCVLIGFVDFFILSLFL